MCREGNLFHSLEPNNKYSAVDKTFRDEEELKLGNQDVD